MLSNKAKRELKINQRRILIDSIEIAIPSPQQILHWGERVLPNGKKVGEVKNSKTVNYKKFTPLRDGLFCERIFGPINSFVCACGKRQTSADVTFCDKCEVEYIDKKVRRSRLGYISLVSPVVHVWYLKGRPSYLSLFLGKRKKQMLALAYCNAYLVEQAFSNIDSPRQISLKQKIYSNSSKETPSLNLKENSAIKNTQPLPIKLSDFDYKSSAFAKEQSQMKSNSLLKLTDSDHHVQSLSKIRQLSNKFHKAKRMPKPSLYKSQALAKTKFLQATATSDSTPFNQDNQVNSATVLNVLNLQDSSQNTLDKLSGKINLDNRLHPTSSFLQELSDFRFEKLPLTSQLRTQKWSQANFSNSNINKRLVHSFLHVFGDILKHTKNNFVLNSYAHTVPTLFVTKSKDQQLNLLDFYLRSLNTDKTSLSEFKDSSKQFFKSSENTQLDSFKEEAKSENLFKNPMARRRLANRSFAETDSKDSIREKKYQTTSQKIKNINAFTTQKVIIKDKETTLLNGNSLSISSNRASIASKSILSPKEYSLNFSLPPYLWYRKRYLLKRKSLSETSYQSNFGSFLTSVDNQTVENKRSEFKDPIVRLAESEAFARLTTESKDQLKSKDNNSILNYFTKLDTQSFLSSQDLAGLKDTKNEECFFLDVETPQKQVKQYNRAQSLPFLPSLICRYNVREELVTFFNSSPKESDLPIPFYCESARWESLYDVHTFMAEQSLALSLSTNDLDSALLNTTRSANQGEDSYSNALAKASLSQTKQSLANFYRPTNIKSARSKVGSFLNGKTFEKYPQSNINSIKRFEYFRNILPVDPDNEKWKYSITKSLPISKSLRALKTYYFDSNLFSLNPISNSSRLSSKKDPIVSDNSFDDNTLLNKKQNEASLAKAKLLQSKTSFLHTQDSNNAKTIEVSNSVIAKQSFARLTARGLTLGKLLDLSSHFAWQKFNTTLENSNNLSTFREQNGKFSILLSTQVANRMPEMFINKNSQNQSFLSKIFINNISQVNTKNSFELRKETTNQTLDLQNYKEIEINSEILTSISISSRVSNLASIYSRIFYLLFTFEKRLFHNLYTPFLEKSIKQFSFSPPVYQNYVSVNSNLSNRLRHTPLSLFLILPKLKAATIVNTNNVVSLAVQKFNPIFENFCRQKIETFSNTSDTSFFTTTPYESKRNHGVKEGKGQNSNLYMFIETRGLNFAFNPGMLSTELDPSKSLENNETKPRETHFTESEADVSKNGVGAKTSFLQARVSEAKQSFSDFINETKLNFTLSGKASLLDNNSLNICNVQIQPILPLAEEIQKDGSYGDTPLNDDVAQRKFFPKIKGSINLEECIQDHRDILGIDQNSVYSNKTSQFVLTRNICFAQALIVQNKNKGSEENTSSNQIVEEGESFAERQEDLDWGMDRINDANSNISFEGYATDSEEEEVPAKLSLEREFLLAKYLATQKAGNWNLFTDNISYDTFSKEQNNSDKINSIEHSLSDFVNKPSDFSSRFQLSEFDDTADLYSTSLNRSESLQDNNASKQAEMLSYLELNTIREILAYTGGGALESYLKRINVISFFTFLSADIAASRLTYKDKLTKIGYGNQVNRKQKRVLARLARRISINSRRLKIIQLFLRNNRRPEWMMISVLPVLPPDLRPILQMSESVVIASDINNLYQRVIYRNNRFHKLGFIDSHLVTAIQRLVQDAVDRLIENGKGASKPFYTPAGRPLKSLSDTLKGKKGRFRYNLLGKRVDFSGRSVIVVSPQLKIHECGLPKEIALELYHYFLLRQILLKKQANSIVIAKKLIRERKPAIWDMLRDIIYHHPVLLNRAPTLHRLGIQAFQPKLIDGNAIWLHPLVCSAFNADFDGDQMGVHLPLSLQARAEAWDLLWSRNNLLSPATGQPVLVPSQDMVLGFYYMTQSFASLSSATSKFSNAKLSLRSEQTNFDKTRLPEAKDPNKTSLLDFTDIKPAFSKSEAAVAKTKFLPDGKPSGDSKISISNKNTLSKIKYSFDGRTKRVLNVRQLSSSKQFFFDKLQLLHAFQSGQITIHTPVWLALNCDDKFEHDKDALLPLELRINSFANSTYIYSEYKRRKDESTSHSISCIRTTPGKVLVNTFL